ncbi:hypothetical protein L3V86_08870 [Thiotrichales bacterium 19S11-10]|nr:hypothetical protein [Thiotrichales bacterium 19S11-10]
MAVLSREESQFLKKSLSDNKKGLDSEASRILEKANGANFSPVANSLEKTNRQVQEFSSKASQQLIKELNLEPGRGLGIQAPHPFYQRSLKKEQDLANEFTPFRTSPEPRPY